ncbi:MAG: hypothetical protein G01um10147_851 [Microgenomates group bacterium Gr01-1014_7]|nr:MAG: hypothetical protein G01um10147_851 [Microgenomates group bacterium Gr01-1014_7]
MKQFPNLTLKRVQRKNREIEERYPQDQKIHKITEEGSVEKKKFLGLIKKI